MKISLSTQRRTIVFATLAALVALYNLALMSVQMFNSENYLAHKPNHTYIGELDTPFGMFDTEQDYEQFSTVVERDAAGKPLVEALPSRMILLSTHPDYVRPDHYGWQLNSVVTYVALILFIAIVVLTAWLFIGAIRGFRTGNIFLNSHPRLLRWLSLIVFFYYLLHENRELFRQIAVDDLYGNTLPFDLYGFAIISNECIVAPLLLLIFAELMAVAARINEDEVMTI